MALALDSTSNSGVIAAASSATWAHTCTGANGIIVVGAGSRDTTKASVPVSTVTYNGDACEVIRQDITPDSVQWCNSALHYRVGPDTGGSYNVVVTFVGTVDDAGCGAISMTGAIQSTSAIDASNGNAELGKASPQSVSVTTVADNCWVIAATYNKTGTDPFTPNNTSFFSLEPRAGGDWAAGQYFGPKTPAGSVASSWTYTSGSDDYAETVVSIAPLVESSVSYIGYKTLLGTGQA